MQGSNSSFTLPFEASRNIGCMDLSPDGSLLLVIDINGQGIVVNFERRVVLHRMGFKGSVECVKFSPCGKYFAIGRGRQVQIWRTPGLGKEFSPFELHRTYTGPFDDVLCIDWSSDSQFIVAGSQDLSARVFSVEHVPGFIPTVMSGHRAPVVAAFFGKDNTHVYTITRDAALFTWTTGDKEETDEPPTKKRREEMTWRLDKKHYFNQNHARVMSAALHKDDSLLVVGFSNGVFGIYELPDCTTIHTLSMSSRKISTVAVNCTGEWLVFGCSKHGQILVWEWQSETSILKQQGHDYNMDAAGYSHDGQIIATGGDDGKVKLWSTTSSFCFVTFNEHTAPVTAVEFLRTGSALVSASLDGTVRAYDTLRYRNFRTFTAPQSAQFSSVAVDGSGEIVCAGCSDLYDIFVWSVQTARLLDTLSGHEGPISCLAFSPIVPVLASGSWDNTVRLWDVYSASTAPEVLRHSSEVLALAYRPDGKELCVATADAQLHMWDPSEGVLLGSIEGRRDLAGGRISGDLRSHDAMVAGQSFRSICYNGDGSCVLAGGNGKYVCLYAVRERVLIARYQVSENRCMQGVLDRLSSKHMTAAGPMDGIDMDDGPDESLPGARRGDMSSRSVKPAVRVSCLRFSPTSRAWCAATTEGLLVYAKDESIVFDPFDLSVEVTPQAAKDAIQSGRHGDALIMALRLGDRALMRHVITSVPLDTIGAVIHSTPVKYINALLSVMSDIMTSSPHIEVTLTWVNTIFAIHGMYIKDHSQVHTGVLKALQQTTTHRVEDLRAVSVNTYMLGYMGMVSKQ